MQEALHSIPIVVSLWLVMPVIPALKRRSGEIRTSRYPWLHGEFEPSGDPDSTNQQNNAVSQHSFPPWQPIPVCRLPPRAPRQCPPACLCLLPKIAQMKDCLLTWDGAWPPVPISSPALLSVPSLCSLYLLATLRLNLPMVHREDSSREPPRAGWLHPPGLHFCGDSSLTGFVATCRRYSNP